MLAAVLACLLLFEQTTWIAFISWLIFAIAAGTDWIDGYFARRYKSETILGQLMDPLADKVLVATALIMLIPLHRLPAWLALVWDDRSHSQPESWWLPSSSQRDIVGAWPLRIALSSTGFARPSISMKITPGTSVFTGLSLRPIFRCMT